MKHAIKALMTFCVCAGLLYPPTPVHALAPESLFSTISHEELKARNRERLRHAQISDTEVRKAIEEGRAIGPGNLPNNVATVYLGDPQSPILALAPHSGLVFEQHYEGLRHPEATDALFNAQADVGTDIMAGSFPNWVVANFSRTMVDLNRRRGHSLHTEKPFYDMGWLATQNLTSKEVGELLAWNVWSKTFTKDENEQLLQMFWDAYYDEIETLVREMVRKHGFVTIPIVHSYTDRDTSPNAVVRESYVIRRYPTGAYPMASPSYLPATDTAVAGFQEAVSSALDEELKKLNPEWDVKDNYVFSYTGFLGEFLYKLSKQLKEEYGLDYEPVLQVMVELKKEYMDEDRIAVNPQLAMLLGNALARAVERVTDGVRQTLNPRPLGAPTHALAASRPGGYHYNPVVIPKNTGRRSVELQMLEEGFETLDRDVPSSVQGVPWNVGAIASKIAALRADRARQPRWSKPIRHRVYVPMLGIDYTVASDRSDIYLVPTHVSEEDQAILAMLREAQEEGLLEMATLDTVEAFTDLAESWDVEKYLLLLSLGQSDMVAFTEAYDREKPWRNLLEYSLESRLADVPGGIRVDTDGKSRITISEGSTGEMVATSSFRLASDHEGSTALQLRSPDVATPYRGRGLMPLLHAYLALQLNATSIVLDLETGHTTEYLEALADKGLTGTVHSDAERAMAETQRVAFARFLFNAGGGRIARQTGGGNGRGGGEGPPAPTEDHERMRPAAKIRRIAKAIRTHMAEQARFVSSLALARDLAFGDLAPVLREVELDPISAVRFERGNLVIDVDGVPMVIKRHVHTRVPVANILAKDHRGTLVSYHVGEPSPRKGQDVAQDIAEAQATIAEIIRLVQAGKSSAAAPLGLLPRIDSPLMVDAYADLLLSLYSHEGSWTAHYEFLLRRMGKYAYGLPEKELRRLRKEIFHRLMPYASSHPHRMFPLLRHVLSKSTDYGELEERIGLLGEHSWELYYPDIMALMAYLRSSWWNSRPRPPEPEVFKRWTELALRGTDQSKIDQFQEITRLIAAIPEVPRPYPRPTHEDLDAYASSLKGHVADFMNHAGTDPARRKMFLFYLIRSAILRDHYGPLVAAIAALPGAGMDDRIVELLHSEEPDVAETAALVLAQWSAPPATKAQLRRWRRATEAMGNLLGPERQEIFERFGIWVIDMRADRQDKFTPADIRQITRALARLPKEDANQDIVRAIIRTRLGEYEEAGDEEMGDMGDEGSLRRARILGVYDRFVRLVRLSNVDSDELPWVVHHEAGHGVHFQAMSDEDRKDLKTLYDESFDTTVYRQPEEDDFADPYGMTKDTEDVATMYEKILHNPDSLKTKSSRFKNKVAILERSQGRRHAAWKESVDDYIKKVQTYEQSL